MISNMSCGCRHCLPFGRSKCELHKPEAFFHGKISDDDIKTATVPVRVEVHKGPMKLLSESTCEAQNQRQRLISELGNLSDHIRSLNERRSFVQSELSKIERAPAGLVGQDMPASKKIKFQSPKPVQAGSA